MLDAESLFLGITLAISDLIAAISGEGTLVLLVEDTHWLDPLSVRLLGDLVSARKKRRLLALLTSRDVTPLADSTRHADRVTVLALDGISINAATNLVVRAIGDLARDSTLTDWMASISAGNPLFIATVTSHYLMTRERFSVPTTLRSLMTKRLETVDKRVFAVLQMCAVLGKCCTLSRLVTALQMPQIDLLESLQEAQARRLISIDQTRVSVVHALVADAVLEKSMELALRVAHRRAATVLGAETSSTPAANELWELAEHWVSAAEYDRALEAFRACANHAVEIGRPREAGLALRRALDLSQTQPSRASLGRELVATAVNASEYELAREGVVAWRSAESEVDHDELEVAELRTNVLLFEDTPATVSRLLACMTARDASVTHRVQAGTMALIVAQNGDRPELADRTWRVLEDLVSGSPDDPIAVEFLLIYHYAFGGLDEAAEFGRRLLRLTHLRAPMRKARDQLNASRALWAAGYLPEALSSLENAYSIAQQFGLKRLAFHCATRLANFQLDLDRVVSAKALLWLERAEDAASEAPNLRSTFEYSNVRSQFALCEGSFDEARRYYGNHPAMSRSAIGQRWNQRIQLRARQVSGDTRLSDVSLDPIITAATTLPRQEVADTEMAIVVEALLARRSRLQAKAVLTDYLTRTRLTRNPLDFALADTARRVGISLVVYAYS
jgi:hypothetical protein